MDRLLWAWRYQPPLDAVINGLKFSRLDYLGRQLGNAAIESLSESSQSVSRQSAAVSSASVGTASVGTASEAIAACDLVVPIPLHWHRRLQRGYDQAELIASAIADRLDLPLARALRRRRSTKAQSQLPREARLRNVRGAFVARKAHHDLRHTTGRRVLLIDDVTTTSATLRAAARALKKAGASQVVALAIARAPEPGEG